MAFHNFQSELNWHIRSTIFCTCWFERADSTEKQEFSKRLWTTVRQSLKKHTLSRSYSVSFQCWPPKTVYKPVSGAPIATHLPSHAFLLLSSSSPVPEAHACWSLSGDSSSVMTVNSSVLPFSWMFSLFMRVTISCSLSWLWELDAAAAPLPSLPSLDVITRVFCLPHQLQKAHVNIYLYRCFPFSKTRVQ